VKGKEESASTRPHAKRKKQKRGTIKKNQGPKIFTIERKLDGAERKGTRLAKNSKKKKRNSHIAKGGKWEW